MSGFISSGLKAELIYLKNSSQGIIWSEIEKKAITNNGNHFAVKIGDQVFDNIHKSGIGFEKWLADLLPRTGTNKAIFGEEAIKALELAK